MFLSNMINDLTDPGIPLQGKHGRDSIAEFDNKFFHVYCFGRWIIVVITLDHRRCKRGQQKRRHHA